MKVNVRFYSFFRQIAGVDKLSVDLKEGATVSDLLASLSKRFANPALESEKAVTMINQKHCPLETILSEGDTVLLLPPLSGG